MSIVEDGVTSPTPERLSSNGHAAQPNSDQPSTARREAILYVPGLFSDDEDFETIVAKFSDAATTFGRTMSQRYQYAKAAVHLKPLDSASTPAYSISEISSGTPIPVVDVFRLDYEACVVGEYARASVFMKALQLIFTLRWLAPAILKTAKASYRKTTSQRNQLIYALAILVAVAIYFLLTFIAIIEIVVSAFTHQKQMDPGDAMTAFGAWFSTAFPGLAFLAGAAPSAMPVWRVPSTSIVSTAADTAAFAALWCRAVLELGYHKLLYMPGTFVVAHATVVAVVLTALGLANPKLRSDFEETMNHMLAAIEYFRIGFARNMTTGRFYDLYDDLCKATDRYDRVNVMGYSFGALVALDALFYTRGVDQTRTDRLGDLITIGAPITLAQNFWPKHFDTIYANFSPGGDHQWINAQCALDVLAAPILDRPPDPIIAAGAAVANVAKQKGSWAARRPAELARQTTDVLTDPGDPNNINFSRKINLDYSGWYPLDLNVPEFFSLAAIRAHAMYWTPRSEPAYNAFDRIAPQLFRVRVPQ